ncbi:MAG TPA: adenylate kinase [Cyclobacteriaceae bacterium]|nr:adenylate kinase [Cyclobacteriaceae bacterium]
MLNMIIFGPPGAGKGTQSQKLIDKYGLVHISTGDLFRWHTKNNTPLGQKVNDIMASGMLVPDEITIAMLEEEVEKTPDASGFLFDGFPRTVAQAEALDAFMKSRGMTISCVVALDVSEDELRQRIARRKDIEKRADDDEEKLNKRIGEYFAKTVKVLPYYEGQGKLYTVNGVGAIDDIFQSICAVIEKVT